MKESNAQKALKYLLFLISPWISLFYSIKFLNTKSTYYVIFGFCVLFGLAFTPSLESELDSARYYQYFLQYGDINFSQYFRDFKEYFNNEGEIKDFFLHTLTFVVSIFTTNVHFLFATFALIFTYFYLKSFKYLTLNDLYDNKSVICLFMAFIFTLSNPIFNINGVRFWTASWMAIYFTFRLIWDNKSKYLVYALVLPFIHASFWIYIFLLLISKVIRNKRFLILAFLTSFFISGLMLTFLSDLTPYLPRVLVRYIEIYTSESYINYREDQVANVHWYIKVLNATKVIYPNVLIYILIKNSRVFKVKSLQKLFYFVLILGVFVNLTISIPSVGNRFQMLLYPLISVLWMCKRVDFQKYKLIIYAFPLVYLLDLYLLIENIKEVLDPYFYISPPFYFIYHIIMNF